jgi:uncharacterized protein
MKIILIIIFSLTAASAQPELPLLKKWATDFTGTLTSNQLDNLNSRLENYEDTTTNQLVMLMIRTLNDYPIESYSYEVAEKNKIGTKENNNGALLFIAKDDRKLRIEVGYGLEGVLPDALANSIIRNVIIPHFKKDDFYAGISAGIDAIISTIAGEYRADKNIPSDEDEPVLPTLIMIIFGLILFFMRGLGRKGKRGFTYWGGMGGFGGRSSGGFGGGGFSGGGGSFGGGGSSGSW